MRRALIEKESTGGPWESSQMHVDDDEWANHLENGAGPFAEFHCSRLYNPNRRRPLGTLLGDVTPALVLNALD